MSDQAPLGVSSYLQSQVRKWTIAVTKVLQLVLDIAAAIRVWIQVKLMPLLDQ